MGPLLHGVDLRRHAHGHQGGAQGSEIREPLLRGGSRRDHHTGQDRGGARGGRRRASATAQPQGQDGRAQGQGEGRDEGREGRMRGRKGFVDRTGRAPRRPQGGQAGGLVRARGP